MLKGLGEGRIVHYVLNTNIDVIISDSAMGRHRPAIVVNSWPDLGRDDGYANLMVFLDGKNDAPGYYPATHGVTLWAPSRLYSEGGEPGTWHWPEKV